MSSHKFINGDTQEVFNGLAFISSTPKSCLTCGGLWYTTEVNYELTSQGGLPPVLSVRGEQPTPCSPEYDRRHAEPKKSQPSWQEQLSPSCNCWLCDS
jgi:hypothetical protein